MMAVTNGSSARDRTYLLPLGPPGPGTPKTELQGMMLTVTAGEERFAKAVQRAERKERRAKETGRKSDVEDAWDARRKAEDLGRKVGVGKGGVVSVSG